MADRVEHAEHAMSVLMRFVVSLIIPIWALAMVALGVEYRSLWWLGCGLAVGAIGLILLAGNPLAGPVLDVRESWRPLSRLKPGARENKNST
ncbi:hypothetical protein [Candidatus Binatus sp.]|uniref:hypothetical protein n=1 Tax=Candidatus Binatus sp. TaxID=2811406 RepID=UPI002F928F46